MTETPSESQERVLRTVRVLLYLVTTQQDKAHELFLKKNCIFGFFVSVKLISLELPHDHFVLNNLKFYFMFLIKKSEKKETALSCTTVLINCREEGWKIFFVLTLVKKFF